MLKSMKKQVKLEKRLIKLSHKKGLLKHIDYNKIFWNYNVYTENLVLCCETKQHKYNIDYFEIFADVVFDEYWKSGLYEKIEISTAYEFIKYLKSKPTVTNNNRIRKYIKINRKDL